MRPACTVRVDGASLLSERCVRYGRAPPFGARPPATRRVCNSRSTCGLKEIQSAVPGQCVLDAFRDAQNFRRQLRERFTQFNRELAEEKTRLLLFGCRAAIERFKHGQRPETFEFLGLRHVCGADRAGRFALIRIPCIKSCRKFLAPASGCLDIDIGQDANNSSTSR